MSADQCNLSRSSWLEIELLSDQVAEGADAFAVAAGESVVLADLAAQREKRLRSILWSRGGEVATLVLALELAHGPLSKRHLEPRRSLVGEYKREAKEGNDWQEVAKTALGDPERHEWRRR